MTSSVPTRPQSLYYLLLLLSYLGLSFSNIAMAKDYIVKFQESHFTEDSLMALQAEQNLRIKDTHPAGFLALVSWSKKENDQEKIAALESLPEVVYVTENILFHAFDTPNDPQFSSQWALAKVGATAAWDKQKGNPAITVAIIDTGVAAHPDLNANAFTNKAEIPGNGKDDDNNGFIDDTNGWDFKDNDNNPNDETSSKNPGHGTHCAGIIGAVGNNGTGISGLAQSVSLMPVRFLGADGSGDLMAAAKAIDYATSTGAHIISASWGAAVPRNGVKPILEAIQRAEAKGVIFVAAAANNGKSNDSTEVYPANAGFSNVISVAASDSQDQKPSWSNYGKATVDLASPGLDILSTLPGGKYQNLSGTSMATPLVAGAVALLLSQAKAEGKSLSPLAMRAILQASGAKVSIETACACRIDIAKALDHLSQNLLTVVPNAATLAVGASKDFSAIGGTGPYTFRSSNASVASITSEGKLKALANGETQVSVSDATGVTATSQTIYVGKSSDGGGDKPACPFGPYCDILCKINPAYPWCS